MGAIIKVEHLSHRYSVQWAIKDINIEIPRKGIYGLLGSNGAGKSTLMNLLSKSDVFAENKLFATLDTTVRKIAIKNVPFLLADTVGFIRKLPHHLVESFKSTLDEVREADVILHVVDISHPQFEDQMKVVNATLAELIKEPKPTIIIFNKIDAFHYVQKEEDDLTPVTRENYSLNDLKQMWMSRQGSETVYISAVKKENIEELKEKLYDIVKEIHSARFPYNDFLYQDYTENNANVILPDGCVAPDVTLSRIDSLCTYTTADHGLVMRKGPGTNYEKMDNIPYGIIVWECGYSSNVPDWVVVYYNGIYGWVSDEYLATTIYSTSK